MFEDAEKYCFEFFFVFDTAETAVYQLQQMSAGMASCC